MSIHVALSHVTHNTTTGERIVAALVRLRPAPHCRTPILSYSSGSRPRALSQLEAGPAEQLRGAGAVPKGRRVSGRDNLVAEWPSTIRSTSSSNRKPSCRSPTTTWQRRELEPFLDAARVTPRLAKLSRRNRAPQEADDDFLVALNHRLQLTSAYLIRLDPGVQYAGGDARAGIRVLPRYDVAAGATATASWSCREVCVRYLIQPGPT